MPLFGYFETSRKRSADVQKEDVVMNVRMTTDVAIRVYAEMVNVGIWGVMQRTY